MYSDGKRRMFRRMRYFKQTLGSLYVQGDPQPKDIFEAVSLKNENSSFLAQFLDWKKNRNWFFLLKLFHTHDFLAVAIGL